MSDNYRKNVSQYTLPVHAQGTKVYRPNSMRQVSVEKELNRLKARNEYLLERLAAVGQGIDEFDVDKPFESLDVLIDALGEDDVA